MSVLLFLCISLHTYTKHTHTHTAVDAALRGDDAQPTRVDSISVGLNQGLNQGPPPLPTTPRPAKPPHTTHSTAANGRHSSHSSPSSQRSRTEPLPPPPVGRPRADIAPPPLPNRATSPGDRGKDNTPVSPPVSRDGPPPPGRRGPPPQRMSQSRRPPTQRHASSTSLQGQNFDLSSTPDRLPPPSPRMKEEIPLPTPSGPILPPRQLTGGQNPPLPPNRPGSQRAALSQKPDARKLSPPGRPPPGGNRPKPSIPTRPRGVQSPIQPPPTLSKPTSRGGSRGDEVVPNIPTGDGMTPREMLDAAQREIPNLVSAISNRYSGVPQCLEDLATLCENIADQARCSGVKYRFTTTSLRSSLSTLRDNTHASWHSNKDRITETLNAILGHVNSLSKGLIE